MLRKISRIFRRCFSGSEQAALSVLFTGVPEKGRLEAEFRLPDYRLGATLYQTPDGWHLEPQVPGLMIPAKLLAAVKEEMALRISRYPADISPEDLTRGQYSLLLLGEADDSAGKS